MQLGNSLAAERLVRDAGRVSRTGEVRSKIAHPASREVGEMLTSVP